MSTQAIRAHLLDDPYLEPYREIIQRRAASASKRGTELAQGPGALSEFACAHEYYGLHKTAEGWIFREWAPNAIGLWLVGDFTGWFKDDKYLLTRIGSTGQWEIRLPLEAIKHGQYYRLEMAWNGGCGERIPAYARRVVQNPETHLFAAQVWDPPTPYVWKNKSFTVPKRTPLIYEAHVGMAHGSAQMPASGVGSLPSRGPLLLRRLRRRFRGASSDSAGASGATSGAPPCTAAGTLCTRGARAGRGRCCISSRT